MFIYTFFSKKVANTSFILQKFSLFFVLRITAPDKNLLFLIDKYSCMSDPNLSFFLKIVEHIIGCLHICQPIFHEEPQSPPLSPLCPSSSPHNPRIKRKTTTHINEKFKTMSKRHTDSTPDEKEPKRRKLSDSVLVEAARNGDTTAVRVGLEKLIPDTDSKRVAFDAVHEACRGNHDECLALLLPYVETTQMGFGMLLSECIHADHTACTEVLLQHWKSVCSKVAFVPHGQEDKKDRACPAMWADPAVCQVLIDAGADMETKDDMGRSPLHWACRSGALAVAKVLVQAGAGVCVTDYCESTCLILAAYHGHTETVRYLVRLKEVDVNHKDEDGFTAVLGAAQQNQADVMKVLIDAGADVEAKNIHGRSPLLCASVEGHLDIVKMLVEAGAGVCVTDNKGDTCLTLAANFGHTETVRYLVGLKDVDVNHKDEDGSTAVLCAVLQKHSDVVEVFIGAGADIEVKDDDGRSPLLCASVEGHLDILKMLVKAGAGVCVTDNEGDTCLTLAASFGHTETVRTLLCMPEVDVNHQGMNNQTALHSAVDEGHPDVVQLLIDAGADIEVKDEVGRSPLLCASVEGHLDIVKMLVEAGAGTDKERVMCCMLASQEGHTCAILRAYVRDVNRAGEDVTAWDLG